MESSRIVISSIKLVSAVVLSGVVILGLSACAPTEEDQVRNACEWYNQGADALSADATNALVYFQKSADEFQVLADKTPEKFADAYAMAEKWASGTGFNAGDLETAMALETLCSD
jgi:outer membrane protein assembly factor BamD (BamD/ComL family)